MAYSASSPLPPVRHDITAYEFVSGMVALYDDSFYAPNTLRLPTEIVEFLELLDGERSAEFLAMQAARAGRSFSTDDFLEVVETLDREYFLQSPRFEDFRAESDRAFNALASRPAAHAGISYPEDPVELRAMFDSFLAADRDSSVNRRPPVAVVAPHIDFRVGGISYGPAYNALRHSDADTFVIFGTSHRVNRDTFMISRLDFETPLGMMPTDREFIDHFRANLPFQLTRDETPHRREHSIEFQAVFLRHIFPDRDINIVPILTGGLHEYVEFANGTAENDQRLNTLYGTLERTAEELGRKVCYIAGADLCHIGRKFGDDFDARSILEEVREFDYQVLEQAARPDAEGFLKVLTGVRNKYRVCGVAPIYATLRSAKPATGEVLCYAQWDESERDSAVTFASLAFYK
ncbi:MAG: AmmeMemoRadiSam system protein B [Candidatus Kapaibacterium sp.]